MWQSSNNANNENVQEEEASVSGESSSTVKETEVRNTQSEVQEVPSTSSNNRSQVLVSFIHFLIVCLNYAFYTYRPIQILSLLPLV